MLYAGWPYSRYQAMFHITNPLRSTLAQNPELIIGLLRYSGVEIREEATLGSDMGGMVTV